MILGYLGEIRLRKHYSSVMLKILILFEGLTLYGEVARRRGPKLPI